MTERHMVVLLALLLAACSDERRDEQHNGAPPQASQTHTHGGANAWLWYWVAMNNSRAHGNSAPAAVFRYRDSTPPVMATRVASVRATARAPGGVASRGGVRGERRRVGRWVKTRFPVKQT